MIALPLFLRERQRKHSSLRRCKMRFLCRDAPKLIEGLSATNTLGERAIRPLVVIRKVSGGSRSAAGTQTRLALASLFHTWQARGQNPLEACLNLLSQSTASPL